MAVILKKQTIRNIASIVRADIDYEKGLVDAGTGTPSPLFLIYGDTGAGKTAILDALSLALYKTTPRIEAVGNKSNNKFKDANGFDVNVFGIQQYTRVGISSKDECFAEVEFVDRKGRLCTARLDLGYASTGKYKAPAWRYTVDGKEYAKDADIEALRNECIGIDFAQYQQTCMLAQGKFDAFLTGGREERQRIMEQLTNTQRFTDFGNAITECFNLHKKEKESAEVAVNNYSVLLLTAQQLADLKDESASLLADIALLDKAISQDETKKTTTERLLSAINDKTIAETTKRQLDAQSISADHLANVKMVADWDGSNDARQALYEYDKAVNEIAASQQALLQDEQVFTLLDNDLLCRREAVDRLKTDSLQVAEWLSDNAPKSTLYAKVGEITTKMKGCLSQREAIARNEDKLAEEHAKNPLLRQKQTVALNEYSEAREAARRVNDLIAKLNGEKEALRPADITNDLTSANDLKNTLDVLKRDVVEHDEITAAVDTDNVALAGLKESLATLDRECRAADDEYDIVKIESDNTNRIYGDVMLGKDEMLRQTREQLALDKADTCPLCGSHVTDWAVNLDAVLMPLMEQKRLKDEALQTADLKRKDVIGRHGIVNGEIRRLENEIAAQHTKLSKVARRIQDVVATTGLDPASDLMPQLIAAISDVTNRISQLNARNQQVLDLDRQIKGKYAELTDAQRVLRDKENAKTNADNALNANEAEIQRLSSEIAAGRTTLDDTISDINSLLVGHYGEWHADIHLTITALTKDAAEYDAQQKTYDRLQAQSNEISATIDTISSTRDNIMTLCTSWTHTPSPLQHPSPNITSEWNNLHNRVYSSIECIRRNSTTKSNSISLLDRYYAQSGNDEPTLRTVMAKAPVIESLRQSIVSLNQNIALQQHSVANAVATIANCCDALSIADPSQIEPLADILQRLGTNKQARDSKNMRFGEIDNKIKSDAANHRLYDDAQSDFQRKSDRFERWKRMNDLFGKNRLCLLVQSYIMRPLLNNANVYLQRITDRYTLTFNSQNEQLSILVLDRYNQNQIRSATVLSGGERFMISLALSLALSALNRSDSNFNVLFIDEGFGTLDEKSLDSVMKTLEMLPYITGQSDRRVGIISHIEELVDRIPTQIQVVRQGDGRSTVVAR